MKRHFLDFVGMSIPGRAGADFVRLVTEHPDLSIPTLETHYFSSDKISAGPDWYEQQFKNLAPTQKRGEFSTSYLSSPGAAARIAREYPDARIVALITDPIEAVAQLYAEAIARVGGRTTTPSLEVFLESQPRLVEQFRFGRYLQTYAVYYSPIDFFVCTLGDVRAAPVSVLSRIYAHLEVDATFIPKELIATVDEEVVGRPSRLLHLLRIDAWRAKRRAMKKAQAATLFPYPSVTITAREFQLLAQYFAPDVEQLGHLLHRDLLTEWKYPKITHTPKRKR